MLDINPGGTHPLMRERLDHMHPIESFPGILEGALYHFHEGDIFFPGAPLYVYEPRFERTPLQGIWGNAFLRVPNTFNPVQPPQVMSVPRVKPNGIGGLQAGTFALEPLEEPVF
jgi:hypothetical protein